MILWILLLTLSTQNQCENMVESPIVERIPSSKYKLKLKYGGFFRLAKNSHRNIYCFGSQKCIYIDKWSYSFSQLKEEVIKRYSSKSNVEFTILYFDKCDTHKSYIELDSDDKFMGMLSMYEKDREVIIYVTTENNHGLNNVSVDNSLGVIGEEQHGDEDNSDYCPSEESYYSHLISDNEDELMNYEDEAYSASKSSLSIKVNTKMRLIFDCDSNFVILTSRFL